MTNQETFAQIVHDLKTNPSAVPAEAKIWLNQCARAWMQTAALTWADLKNSDLAQGRLGQACGWTREMAQSIWKLLCEYWTAVLAALRAPRAKEQVSADRAFPMYGQGLEDDEFARTFAEADDLRATYASRDAMTDAEFVAYWASREA